MSAFNVCFSDNKTDHAVLLVGYGTENGVLYWLIKNSWSHNWGDNGFIKIKHGLCGVEKRPFVVLNKGRKPLPWQLEEKAKKEKEKQLKEKLREEMKAELAKQDAAYDNKIVRKDAIEDPDFRDIEDDDYLDDVDFW